MINTHLSKNQADEFINALFFSNYENLQSLLCLRVSTNFFNKNYSGSEYSREDFIKRLKLAPKNKILFISKKWKNRKDLVCKIIFTEKIYLAPLITETIVVSSITTLTFNEEENKICKIIEQKRDLILSKL